MNFQTKIKVAIFITIIAFTIFACKLFQKESQRTTQQGFYAIQPEMILNAIAYSEDNVFLPITEHDVNVVRSAPPNGSSVNWTQFDYLYIVDAFYKVILHDTLSDWHLNSMDFSMSCSEVATGMQDGRFEFFKIVKNEDNQEVLISRFIDVDPRYKVVLFWEREFYPYVFTRSSIDPTNIKFDSTKVLQIAEDGGGRNQRLAIKNACDISLDLSPDSVRYRGWKVVYRGDGVAFEINVDPFTGDIH